MLKTHPHIAIIRLLIGLTAFVGPLKSNAQVLHGMVNRCIQITLHSRYLYGNPHIAATLDCEFHGPNGETMKNGGFWDGDSIWKIRFSAPTEGRWTYRTVCSDTLNQGLHGIEGELDVEKYSGTDVFAVNGWPKISADGHYLTYGNGSPWFYLGDTAWEITWKSYFDEVRKYISDRRKKGFDAIQIVTMSHQVLHEFGVMNRSGNTYFLDEDYSKLNPRYFDYLDSIVQLVNDSGMVAVLVPLWAAMSEVNRDSVYQRFCLTKQQSLLDARYIGSRYAGYNVMWIVGGDNYYDTPERKSFWSEFAHTLQNASGRRHLTTMHPHGWGASFDYFDNFTDWLDLHMYQSSHVAGGDYTWYGGSTGYQLFPPKPVLNGEAVYEDIHDRLWAPGDTTQVETPRITPADIRQANFESVFSGAIVGITYGANGVWQWNTAEIPGSHSPSHYVLDAIKMPGSTGMAVFKSLMWQYHWYQLKSRQDLINFFTGKENYLPIADNGSKLLVFFPKYSDSASIAIETIGNRVQPGDYIKVNWINPADGQLEMDYPIFLPLSDTIVNRVPVTLTPKDTNDWLVEMQYIRVENPSTINPVSYEFSLLPPSPNPFRGSTKVDFILPDIGNVKIEWWNILGDYLGGADAIGLKGIGSITTTDIPSGVCFYRFTYTPLSGLPIQRTGTALSLGH